MIELGLSVKQLLDELLLRSELRNLEVLIGNDVLDWLDVQWVASGEQLLSLLLLRFGLQMGNERRQKRELRKRLELRYAPP